MRVYLVRVPAPALYAWPRTCVGHVRLSLSPASDRAQELLEPSCHLHANNATSGQVSVAPAVLFEYLRQYISPQRPGAVAARRCNTSRARIATRSHTWVATGSATRAGPSLTDKQGANWCFGGCRCCCPIRRPERGSYHRCSALRVPVCPTGRLSVCLPVPVRPVDRTGAREELESAPSESRPDIRAP